MEINELTLLEFEVRLHAFFIKHIKLPYVAEDYTQDILLKLWINREKLSKSKNLEGYVYKMARNLIIDHFRRAKYEESYQKSLFHTLQHTEPAAIKKLVREDFNLKLRQVLDTLPPRQKEVFELCKFHGLSHDEIAERMDISNKTVRNYLFEAMKGLQKNFQVDSITLISAVTLYL